VNELWWRHREKSYGGENRAAISRIGRNSSPWRLEKLKLGVLAVCRRASLPKPCP
jgi:hypothetical protein